MSQVQVKKPLSAYLLFSNEVRAQVCEKHPGLRMGENQKILSQLWRELDEKEKQRYTDMAHQAKEKYLEQVRSMGETQVGAKIPQQEAAGISDSSSGCVYPIGRVKRIVRSDPEAGTMNRDALHAVAKASEIFVRFLAAKSYERALFAKKRQIKESDVLGAIHSISALDWLREDFPLEKASVKVADGNSSARS